MSLFDRILMNLISFDFNVFKILNSVLNTLMVKLSSIYSYNMRLFAKIFCSVILKLQSLTHGTREKEKYVWK